MIATALELLRVLGLRVDGPGVWDRPVRAERPGVFVFELPTALPTAPVDLSHLGRWLQHVESLQVDGARPTGKALAARLARFWIPGQQVVYVGHAPERLSATIAALSGTLLGDPLPDPRARWVRTLREFERTRVWWAETPAAEEYEDALLEAFAAQVDPGVRATLHDPRVILPFANLSTATGIDKSHGISGDLLPEPPQGPTPTIVTLPPGDEAALPAVGRGVHAVGVGAPRPPRAAGRPARPKPAPERKPHHRESAAAAAPVSAAREVKPVYVSATGLAKLQAELHELTTVRRPEVIHRVRAARELGDLRENADYESARKEQSFVEGRIATLEAMIRHAVIIEEPAAGGEVVLGSSLVVESDGSRESYAIVGSAEADPAQGRISYTSPLGSALLGHTAGDEVTVHAPAGQTTYRIVEVR